MPTPLENELGLGPAMHRFRRWTRSMVSRLGNGAVPPGDYRPLDPLTVNYAAWHEVRRTVREWPQYKEAANSLEILVSPEDWEDYWGIDTARKEAGVAAYIRDRAAEKGYWIAGEPQVMVMEGDTVSIGEVEVFCQFVETLQEDGSGPALVSNTAAHEPLQPRMEGYAHARGGEGGIAQRRRTEVRRQAKPVGAQTQKETPTMRFAGANGSAEAYLTDEYGFRLVLKPGDCIGAVSEDEDVPSEVNVRLDAVGFPYVEPMHCSLDVIEGCWMVTNYARHGTQLVDTDGRRLMLRTQDPYPIFEGDRLYLGPLRPLRFELKV